MKSETKTCQNCKKDFIIEPDDFSFYEKIKVPPPTFCPECRMQRRMIFRNERNLYKRKSDATGKIIFSGYSSESPVKVFETNIWNSDKWDPQEKGVDLDFSKPFLQQFIELHNKVPRPAMGVISMVNSDYCNNATAGKNCYLVFSLAYAENCMYGSHLTYTKDSIDGLFIIQSDLIYDSFQINGSSRIFYSSFSKDSIDIYFSKNLKNCHDCFGCVNLYNKKYFIFNKQYTKERYFEKLKEYNLGSYQEVQKLKEKSHNFWLKFPNKYMEGFSNNDVSGNFINQSKNVKQSFNIEGGEDIKYSQYLYVPKSKNIYDQSFWAENSESNYECLQVGDNTNNVYFSAHNWPAVNNIQYCIYCVSSSNLFGCVGIKKGQYCILNKQYTKEQYEELVPKIIKHMNDMPYVDSKGRIYKYGEFFPPELSPFAYNETIAQEYFPLTKEQALEQGYRWKEREERDYSIDIKNQDIPDNINDVKEDILNKVIECQHQGKCNHQCTEAFKIIPDELQFYQRMNLPIPHLCPNCRHYERLAQRNPMKLWHRQCMCESKNHNHQARCPIEFETSYSPDRKEIIYCEKCYQREVY